MKGKTFNVTSPRILILLSLFLVISFAVYLAFDLLVPRAPSMATIRCLVGFVWIPLLIVIVWVLTFHIRVEGMTIYVRRCMGLVRFTAEASEIQKVCCKDVLHRTGTTRKITVYVRGRRRFTAEALMTNSSKFMGVLKRHVDAGRFFHQEIAVRYK